jgi:hypothetical protein
VQYGLRLLRPAVAIHEVVVVRVVEAAPIVVVDRLLRVVVAEHKIVVDVPAKGP